MCKMAAYEERWDGGTPSVSEGAFCLLETHTHIHWHAHAHTLTHLAMAVHVQLHVPHVFDCSAETALVLQSRRHGRHFVSELTKTETAEMMTMTQTRRPQSSFFCANDFIKDGSKHTYHTQPGKHEAFHILVSEFAMALHTHTHTRTLTHKHTRTHTRVC